MNRSGRQQVNNEAVFEILKTAKRTEDDSFVFVDKENNTFIVDKDGRMYTIQNNITYPCNNGYVSYKKNGYLYVEISVKIDENIVHINYAQHSIVCALYNGLPYDYNLVVNHKNNCPWDNTPSNLEWTTQGLNILHGKIVNSIEKADSINSWLTTFSGVNMIEYKQNLSSERFVTMTTPLSVKTIEAYLGGQKPKDFWGLKDKKSLLSHAQTLKFVQWWIKRDNIKTN